jgi:hypothetical protein
LTEEVVPYDFKHSAETLWNLKTEKDFKFHFQPQVPTIIFNGTENKQIGKLTIVNDSLIFEGNAEESAKIFFEYIKTSWSDYFKQKEGEK